MKKFNTYYLLIAAFALVVSSCQKPPTPAFSYSPDTNIEVGDEISFTNESLEAESYLWEFGDGTNSSDTDPKKTYSASGVYDVALTATNEKSSVQLTKSITVNNPTVLAMYVFQDDTTTVIDDCEVWIFESEDDWNNDYNNPAYADYTDSEGYVEFVGMSGKTYIVDMYKEVDGGVWYAAYITSTLTLFDLNLYGFPLDFIPNQTKATLKSSGKVQLRTPLGPIKR